VAQGVLPDHNFLWLQLFAIFEKFRNDISFDAPSVPVATLFLEQPFDDVKPHLFAQSASDPAAEDVLRPPPPSHSRSSRERSSATSELGCGFLGRERSALTSC
jgi:hypothetical protein